MYHWAAQSWGEGPVEIHSIVKQHPEALVGPAQ